VNAIRRVSAALEPRERWTIAAGLGVVVFAVLALRLGPAGLRLVDSQSARAEQAAWMLSRARDALASQPLAQESLAARTARLVSLAPRLFGGTTPAEAAAEVVSLVSGSALLNQVRIVRQDVSTDSTAHPFLRVRLRLEAEGDVIGVMGWIASLEEGTKLIVLERLVISALEPGAPREQPELLRTELTLSAWSAADLPSAPRGTGDQ